MANRHVSEDDVRALTAGADGGRPLVIPVSVRLRGSPDVEGHRLHSTCPARRVPRSFLATTGFTMSCNSLPRASRRLSSLRRASWRARLREGGRLALIYFVDVPWRFLGGFRKVVCARGGPELIPMTLDRVTVRPIRAAAETAVDAWIGGIVLGEQPEFGAPRANGPSGTAQAPEADRLAARVRELESQLQLASAPAPGLQARPPAPMGGGAFAAAGRHSRLAGDERVARPGAAVEDTSWQRSRRGRSTRQASGTAWRAIARAFSGSSLHR